MPSSRFPVVVTIIVATLCSSCASTRSVVLSPTAEARINALGFNPPPDSEFDPHEGDEQYVDGNIYGRIFPHRSSNGNDGLRHGKYLGRIHVSADYPAAGLKKGWNYWLMADTTGSANPNDRDFVSVVFAAGSNSFRVRPLSIFRDQGHTHGHAQARWRNQSAAMPWATCGPHMCCCEGTSCDARSIGF